MLRTSSAQKSQWLTSRPSLCLLQTEVQQLTLSLCCGLGSTGFSGLRAAILHIPSCWWGHDLLAINQGLGQFLLCHRCKSQNKRLPQRGRYCCCRAMLQGFGPKIVLLLSPSSCNKTHTRKHLQLSPVSQTGKDVGEGCKHALSVLISGKKAPKATKILLPDGKAYHFFTTAEPVTESLFCHSKGESSKKTLTSGTISAMRPPQRFSALALQGREKTA